jgi:hypothetical protein
MKYRKLDSAGDYSFGRGDLDFHIDSPSGVAQAILTSLNLFQGQWFLDLTEGMPWYTQIAGFNTQASYDAIIKNKIQTVQGVNSILRYTSELDHDTRTLSVETQVDTEFGAVTVTTQISVVETGYGVGGYGRRPYGE